MLEVRRRSVFPTRLIGMLLVRDVHRLNGHSNSYLSKSKMLILWQGVTDRLSDDPVDFMYNYSGSKEK